VRPASTLSRSSSGAPAAAPGVGGVELSRGALSPADEPSPTCMAPASTDPQASRVPAARPQARPRRIARPPGTRPKDLVSITETAAPADSRAVTCSPPTQAIRAVAAGPEPDFLRRRAVIVRHQRSPQGSGTVEGYRLPGTSPAPSLLRRSAGAPDRRAWARAVARSCAHRARCQPRCRQRCRSAPPRPRPARPRDHRERPPSRKAARPPRRAKRRLRTDQLAPFTARSRKHRSAFGTVAVPRRTEAPGLRMASCCCLRRRAQASIRPCTQILKGAQASMRPVVVDAGC